MNLNDFAYMQQRIHVDYLKPLDSQLLNPVNSRRGNNRALLLLHGFSSSPAVYRNFLPELSNYDALIVPALPGHAMSINDLAKIKFADLLPFVESICAVLINEFEQVDVMGLSLGGLLACHLSSRFTLNRLYLLAPALELNLNIGGSLYLAKLLRGLGFSRLRNAAGNLYNLTFAEIAYRQIPISAIIEILTLIKNFQLILPACPTEVFLGRHDQVIDPHKIAARLAGASNITIHWLESSAHVLPLDGDAGFICQQLKNNFAAAI